MRVAVNTRLLLDNKLDGIGRFAFETLKRITKSHPEVEFHFIFDRPFSNKFIFNNNIIPHILKPATRHPILWYIWFEIQLPKLIRAINADVLFSPDGFIPMNLNIPTVTTIHDLNFEHRPKDLQWTHSIFYRIFFKKYAKAATQIITVSNFSKEDIIKTYKIDPKKIHVAYHGVSNVFGQVSSETKLKTKRKYSNGKGFFVFVGSLHKRKNIQNLLLSFERYKKNKGLLKLIIIGATKWLDKRTNKLHQNMTYKKDVIFLGKIPDNELATILGSAHALCFISLFEGFGLPIIEAMQSSVPVITSNTSCMPEIAKNAAIIINPYSKHEITNAMIQMEKDDKKRNKLINLGNHRVKDFDWNSSANKIWEIIKLTQNT